MSKYFIITIDTEGDSLWEVGDKIPTTENVNYIPRFQELCEKYNFIPTWLANYEMLMDDTFVSYMQGCLAKGTCEVGTHLHAWNNPPEYTLKKSNTLNHPFLIQYPPEVMKSKLYSLTELCKKKLGILPTSHRAGRWVTNEEYLQILEELGYTVDCSITPHINWKTAVHDDNAVDYRNEYEGQHIIKLKNNKTILEVPMTIKILHPIRCFNSNITVKTRIRYLLESILGVPCWLRPSVSSLREMKKIVKKSIKNDEDYVMFMIHSSELMPGGSPYYKNEIDVEKLYDNLDSLFAFLQSENYKGIALSAFAEKYGN